MSGCGNDACSPVVDGVPAGGGGPAAAVTLQSAIDGQSVVPTTQDFGTTVQLNAGGFWLFTDALGNTVALINTDGSATAFQVIGGVTGTGAGQAVSIAGGTATTNNRTGGSVTIGGGGALGTSQAGTTTIAGGTADPAGTGTGGPVFVFGGDGGGGGGGGPGGDVGVFGGSALVGNQSGGDVGLGGGNASGSAAGGDINKTPGNSSTGRPGLEFSLGAVAWNSIVSSALAAGATQNFNPANLGRANVLRLTPDAGGSSLGGITFMSGQNGRMILLINIGTVVGQALTIVHQDAGSVAANQFFLASGSNLVIPFGGSQVIWYDVTSSRWRPFSG